MRECANWEDFKNNVRNGDFVKLGYSSDMFENIREKQKIYSCIFGIQEFDKRPEGIINCIDGKVFQLNSYNSHKSSFSVIVNWEDVLYATIETFNLEQKLAGLQRYFTIDSKESSRRLYELGSILQVNLLNSDSICGKLKAVGETYITIEEVNFKYHVIKRDQIRSIYAFPFPTGMIYVPEGTEVLPIDQAEQYTQKLVMVVPAEKIGINSNPAFGFLTSVSEKDFELIDPDTGRSKLYFKSDFVRVYKL